MPKQLVSLLALLDFSVPCKCLQWVIGLQEVSRWIQKKATKPVWAKMTPNITDITLPARTALQAGAEGIAAINTIQSVMGINLKTLRPEPSVEGHSTPGGYSCKAVKPIALAKVRVAEGMGCYTAMLLVAKLHDHKETYPNNGRSCISCFLEYAATREKVLAEVVSPLFKVLHK